MSSHHIVKEKQEPALYIDRLGDFNEELLGQLLEWSPTLLVNADDYEKALSLGLKVDIVVGAENPVNSQENTLFVLAPIKPMQAAIAYLVAEKYPAVNVISSVSTFDEIAHFLPDINIVLFTETLKSYAVKPGFSVWKPAETLFKIDIISYFETENLKPTEKGDFKVIKDGFVTFEFATDYLFLSEFL